MESRDDDGNTASNARVFVAIGNDIKEVASIQAVVRNNQRPILGTLSEAETLALGAMLDRLDALEEAVRVRPNARAIAALREIVEISMAFEGGQGDSLATHAAAILLDMFDKIVAAGKPAPAAVKP